MEAELKSFDITTLPYTVRFGLGSKEPIKRWARFTLEQTCDLYWTQAIYVRKDVDSSGIHTSIHKTGAIYSSRYMRSGEKQIKYYSKKVGDIGSPIQDISAPHLIIAGEEYLEPGYLYAGLPSIKERIQKRNEHNEFIPCLYDRLVSSHLHFSLDLVPWIDTGEIICYLTNKHSNKFDTNDHLCHTFIFHWYRVSVVVMIRFTGGYSPIDIQKVAEADKNIHPLKRL